VLRWDRRRHLEPLALQDPEGERLLSGMTEEERMASWRLVTPNGEVHSAGAAAAPLLRLLPGGRAPAAAAGAFPRLTERVYGWVADHRTQLARPIRPVGLRRADELIGRRSASS
jgi:predicted DCC family thiol-disulfide oxidoreductase YuxK